MTNCSSRQLLNNYRGGCAGAAMLLDRRGFVDWLVVAAALQAIVAAFGGGDDVLLRGRLDVQVAVGLKVDLRASLLQHDFTSGAKDFVVNLFFFLQKQRKSIIYLIIFAKKRIIIIANLFQ